MVGLLVLGLFLGACSKGAEGPQSSTNFESLLRLIPDTPDTRGVIQVNDYAAIRELFGIPLPATSANKDQLLGYLVLLNGGAVNPDGSIGPLDEGNFRAQVESPWLSGIVPRFFERGAPFFSDKRYLGFDVTSVDQSIVAGLPPGVLEIVRGRYDPATTEKAISTCQDCRSPERETYRGVQVYKWGPDL